MANPVRRATWLLPIIGMLGAAHGQTPSVVARTPFCDLEYVSQSAKGIELHFPPGGGVFVRVRKAGQGVSPTDQMFLEIEGQMHKTQLGSGQPESATSEVVLSPSDEATVSDNPHSSCKVLPARQGPSLGVIMKISVSLPGLAPQMESRFLPVDTRGSR